MGPQYSPSRDKAKPTPALDQGKSSSNKLPPFVKWRKYKEEAIENWTYIVKLNESILQWLPRILISYNFTATKNTTNTLDFE